MPTTPRRRGRWSLAQQLLLLQLLVVVVLVGTGALLAYLDAASATRQRATDQAKLVAVTVADSPAVTAALAMPEPSAQLQPFAERVRADTAVDFITIMDPAGIRYTHPNTALIGQRFLGNISEAVRGKVFTETYTGTLGPSVRAVVPVFGANRQVVALVSAGITVEAIAGELRERLVPLIAVAAAVLAAGIGGSLLVNARLRRQTRGVAPAELSRMFEYYGAILHAVREGLVLLDRDGRVELCNDGARELLALPDDVVGEPVGALGLPPGLTKALVSDEPRTDEIHVTDTHVLVVSTSPVRSRDGARGTVVTLRDHTDLQALTGELNTVRGFTESLRSQAHEAANRLHTVVSLVEIGRTEEAVEFATEELEIAQRLTDRVVGAVSEPVLAALLLGKAAEASERGAELVVTEETAFDDTVFTGSGIEPRDLVTVLGNLIDNGLDAAIGGVRPRVWVTVLGGEDEILLRVADSGPGVSEEAKERMFRRGWSTKSGDEAVGHGIGLALVGQAVRRHDGRIEVSTGEDGGAVFIVRLPVRRGSGS